MQSQIQIGPMNDPWMKDLCCNSAYSSLKGRRKEALIVTLMVSDVLLARVLHVHSDAHKELSCFCRRLGGGLDLLALEVHQEPGFPAPNAFLCFESWESLALQSGDRVLMAMDSAAKALDSSCQKVVGMKSTLPSEDSLSSLYLGSL